MRYFSSSAFSRASRWSRRRESMWSSTDAQISSASRSSSSYSPLRAAKMPASPPWNASNCAGCWSGSSSTGGALAPGAPRPRPNPRAIAARDPEAASPSVACAPMGGAGAPGPMSERVVNPVAPRPRPATYPGGGFMPWNEGALPAIAAVGGAKSKRCGASKALFLDGNTPREEAFSSN